MTDLDFPHIDSDKPLMLVVDTSVFLHRLDQTIDIGHKDPAFAGVLKANLTWLMSAAFLGHKLREQVKSVVFCKDAKPYWRAEWLSDLNNIIGVPQRAKADKARVERARELMVLGPNRDPEEDFELMLLADKLTIKYKGGRKLATSRFKKIKKLIYKWLDALGAKQLEAEGYEADDMAAALVQHNADKGNPWSILLLTVDTDWLGLINPNVTWACMAGFAPVVRDRLETVNIWAEARLKTKLTHWRDIWTIKGEQGDKSDNLPPSAGLLLPVIDLLNPPDHHKYWLKASKEIGSMFQPEILRFSLAQAKEAKTHLIRCGLAPANRLLPGCTIDPQPAWPSEPGKVVDMVNLLTTLADVACAAPQENIPMEIF